MKKSLFFALFACATLAFVSCKPDPGKEPGTDPKPNDSTATADVVINVVPETLLLGVGDTEKLTAMITPAGTQLKINWTSSDENVVTVAASGIVEAVGVGTATITASAEGATAGTCVVNVSNDAVYETFAFSNYSFFGMSDEEPIVYVPNTEGYVTFTSGDSALCQLGYIALGVWGSEIVEVGGQLAGADNIMFVPMPMYILIDQTPEWQAYYGQLVGGGVFVVDEVGDSIIPYVGSAGALVDVNSYGDFFKQDIASMYDETVEVDVNLYYNAFNGGAEMYFMSFDEEYNTYNTATVKYAEFYDTPEGLGYYAEIEWLDYLNPGRWFGLAVEMDENGYPLSVIEPYDVRIIENVCTNLQLDEEPAQASAKNQFHIINPERVHMDMTVEKFLNTKKMYKK